MLRKMNTPYNPQAPNEGPTIVQPPRLALFTFSMGIGAGNKLPCWYARTCIGCCWYDDHGENAAKWGGYCHHPKMIEKYGCRQNLGLRYDKPHVTPQSCPMLLVPDAWREKIPETAGAVSNA